MTNDLLNDLENFLEKASLSSYEIKAYITLLKGKDLTAREICNRSTVPYGRIYEVLEDLYKKGMILIQESRPKIYNSISFNKALKNLISYRSKERKDLIQNLYDLATKLESRIYDSDLPIKKETSKNFWGRYFGSLTILDQYIRHSKEINEELLLTGFISDKTFDNLQFLKQLYKNVYDAIERGVFVKYLWSFEYDNVRPLTYVHILNNRKKFGILVSKFKDLFNLKIEKKNFEMRFIHNRIPNYFDIFDKERLMIKFQNVSNSSHVSNCLDIVDLKLAEYYRKEFLNIWFFEAIEDNPKAYKFTLWEQLEKSFLR